MMEWISIDQMLPEESSYDYILFCNAQEVFCGRYFDGNSFDGEPKFKSETTGYITRDSEITHWMPLPAPPEVKNE
jgi:hypothetical protein